MVFIPDFQLRPEISSPCIANAAGNRSPTPLLTVYCADTCEVARGSRGVDNDEADKLASKPSG